jgi:hypothetical protein
MTLRRNLIQFPLAVGEMFGSPSLAPVAGALALYGALIVFRRDLCAAKASLVISAPGLFQDDREHRGPWIVANPLRLERSSTTGPSPCAGCGPAPAPPSERMSIFDPSSLW